MIYNTNGLYPRKKQVSNELNWSPVSSKKYLLVMDTV